jgi:NADH-quinone oxidoreductase subunit A
MFSEYIFILKFFFSCLILVILLFFLSFFFVYHKPDSEKLSSYECGFNPFGDARIKFEIRFYLVAILFIIFDLEVTFLFPWAISFSSLTFEGIVLMVIFVLILSLGFAYE